MPLSQLRRITARGQGVTLALTGEAGVGKSERASKFLKSMAARTFQFSAQWPLFRLSTALPPAALEPQWVSILFSRLASGEKLPAPDLAAAAAERLRTHAPALLLLDHFHRAAPETLPFWEALARQVRASRGIGLLMLTRGDAPAGWDTEEVGPLTRAESDALVRTQLQAAYRPDLAAWLYEQARGHPLFTLELLSQVREGDDWVTAGLSVPASLQAFVRSQLPTQLSPELALSLARTLLRADVGGALTEADSEDVAALERCGVVRHGQLAHPIYREALLPLLPPAALATALAEALSGGELGDAVLAADLSEAWPLTPQDRLRLYRAAAEELEAQQHLTRAAEFWEKAAALAPSQRAAWLERASRLYEFYPPQKSLAEAHLRTLRGAVEAAVQAGDGADRVPREWLTRLVHAQGHAGQPLAELAELLSGDTATWETEYRYGTLIGADILDAQAWERWLALSPEQQRAAPAEVLLGVVGTENAPPELEEWFFGEAFRRAPDELTQLQVRGEAAYKPYIRKENMRALREFDAVVGEVSALQLAWRQAAERDGWTLERRLAEDRAEQTIQYFNRARATLMLRLGDFSGSEALQPAVMGYARERQALPLYIGALYRYGWELVNLGQFEEAQHLLHEAYSSRQLRGAVLMALIDLYAMQNREEQAHLLTHHLAEFCAGMRRHPQLQYFFVAAWGLTACGDWEAALTVLEEGEAQARAAQVGHALDYGLWIRAVWHGEQGQLAEGERLAREAAAAASRRGLDREAARYALWGAHYSGDERAYDRAAEAVRGYGDLGHLHAVASRRQTITRPAVAHLQILGPPRLLDAAGQPVRSVTGLRLLILLLHARLLGQAGLSETEITGMLYPEAGPNAARRNLSRLLHTLGRQLGAGVVTRTACGYALGEISSDAELFLNEGAADLWRGPLPLQSDPNAGAVAERLLKRLQEQVTALLAADPARAAQLATILTDSDPYDSAALRLRLHAHDLAQQPAQARAAYAAARETFAEVGEALPLDWRTFLSSQKVPTLPPEVMTAPASAASRARALQVHRSTITRWDTGKSVPSRSGRPARLTPDQVTELRRQMASPPTTGKLGSRWTLKLAAEYVEETFGVRLSQAQLSRLLRQP